MRPQGLREEDLHGPAELLSALVLCADPAECDGLQAALTAGGFEVTAVAGVPPAHAFVREPPDVVVVDGEDDLLAAVRAHPALAHLPVVLLETGVGPDLLADYLAGGVEDFLIKPLHADELVARVLATVRDRRRYGTLLARHDRLTDLVVADARAAESITEDIDRLLQQAHALREEFAVLAVGRASGSWADQVGGRILRLVARSVRLADVIGRYDPATLLVAASQTDARDARLLADRILARARAEGGFDTVVSIGQATREEDDTVHSLVRRALTAQARAPVGGCSP